MSIDLPDDLVPRPRPAKRRRLTGHEGKVARRREGLPKLVCLHEVLVPKEGLDFYAVAEITRAFYFCKGPHDDRERYRP